MSDEPPTAGDTSLAADAADAVRQQGLPAFAIARLSSAGVQTAVAGTVARGDETPVPLDASFHLGSNTKAMTAVVIASLVQEGRLGFDHRLVDVLPEAPVDPSLADVTIRAVLGHRTGLDPVLDLRGLHAADDPVEARRGAVLDALASPEHHSGGFVYANVNYMLAGVIAEELTGQPWEQLVQERIFEPLDMRCGFGAPTGPHAPRGHTSDGTPLDVDAEIADNPPALGPAGTVHCSMQDWATFAEAMLKATTGRDSAVLSGSTASDLFDDDHEYVAGWARVELGGEQLYTHDGSNTLWYARIVLAPQRGEALLMAANTGQEGAVTAMDERTRRFVGA